MKNLKISLFACFLAIAGLTACSNGSSSSTEQEQGKEYTSAYICPMHCDGSGSAKMGECPVCGMDYVKNEKHQAH